MSLHNTVARRRVAADPRQRALVAGCIGNLVEWHDFALYGAFAPIIAGTFFAGDDGGGGLTAAFGVFGVAFAARPAGALLFGHVGDRYGRRQALSAGIVLMALATAAMGLLPGYAVIGWAAPVALGLLRFVQGVSIGGEYGGSAALVVEYAPPGRRGWFGGWQWATVGFGLATGLSATAVLGRFMDPATLQSWGWRLPFLAALPLGLVGVYVRSRLDETPAFQSLRTAGAVSRAPLIDAVRTARRESLTAFVIVAAVVVTFNVFYVFVPSYLALQGLASLGDAFGAALAGVLLGSVAAPAFGALSDRVGRRPILIGGMWSLLLAIVPAASLIQRGDPTGMIVGYSLIGVPLGALALTAWLAELFPTRVRYSGLSLTYGVASALFGGSAPVVAAVLSQRTGDLRAATWYATIVTALAAISTGRLTETAHLPLDRER